MNGSREQRRRGSMYVAVLGSTMVITVIGMSALMLARVERSSVVGTSDLSAARFYAQSAIEMGQHRIRQDSNWRQTYTSGVWEADRTIGSGKYTLEGIDPIDGDLGNSTAEPLVFRSTGLAGQSRYKLQVTMVAKSSALTCLQVAMHAGTSLTFNSATVQSNQVTVSSNGAATASTANVFPKVEVVTAASGAKYWSLPVTIGITPRTMPNATAFDYYTTNGTAIAFSAIPRVSGKATIEKCVLSPSSIPSYVGSTNANGIYVINCGSSALVIRNCRIVGTLVILNPGTFTIESSVLWEPAVANYPSLLVSGDATFNYMNTALSESSLNVNLNPAGTPYLGVNDDDKVDSYPSVINGLVYTSGAVTTQSNVTINGVLVVGTTLTAQNTLNLSYLSTFYDNPPPGFGAAPEMVISPGTWKQLVD